MAEEQGRAGDKGEERIIALLEGLGWTKRGDTNVDVTNDYKYHPDRGNTYGVDGYMTYDGPYFDKERGLIIESKNVKWGSYSGTDLEDWAGDTLEKIEAVPGSDEFDELLNFGKSRVVNAGILSIWTRNEEKYVDETYQGYFDELKLRPKKNGKYQIAVLGNRELNRLASLHQEFQSIKSEEDIETAEFFYPPRNDSHSASLELVDLNYLISDYVFAKGQMEINLPDRTVTDEIGIVFYFDEMNLDSLNFMYQAAVEHGMESVNELRIYVYDDEDTDIQLESVRQEFLSNGKPSEMSGKGPEISIKTLTQTNYADYADSLIEQ